MGEYVLSCESTVDLSREHLARRNISYISYPFELDGKTYRDDLGQTVSYPRFYAAMAAGAETKTAQINAYEFESYFEPFLREGRDILHLCLSSGLTGVMAAARQAKGNLLEKYPERRICLVDSLAASGGIGLKIKCVSSRPLGYLHTLFYTLRLRPSMMFVVYMIFRTSGGYS